MTRHGQVWLLWALAGTAGCAHQTLVESDPPGAEVFVNGERVGVTPVSVEDPAGWSKEFELSIRKDGYERQSVTLVQEAWNPTMLTAAGICGAVSCGLGAIPFLMRSRHLLDRYHYALKLKPKEPGPALEPAPLEGEPGVGNTIPHGMVVPQLGTPRRAPASTR